MSVIVGNPTPRDAYSAAVKGELTIVRDFYINNSQSTPISDSGNTALHEAIRIGSMEIVKTMTCKEECLIFTRNLLGETPLFWAAAYGWNDILHFLYLMNNDVNLLVRIDFSTILHAAVRGKFYGLALEILELCPSLAFSRNVERITALQLIAQSPTSFRSGSIYTLNNIGSSPFVPLEMLAIIIYSCIPSYKCALRHYSGNTDVMQTESTSISGIFRWFIRWCPWLRMVNDAKHKHNLAEELAKQLIAIHTCSDVSIEEADIRMTLLVATTNGIVEVVKTILEKCPHAVDFLDENDKNILHLAAEHRREEIFDLLKSKHFPTISRMVAEVDIEGNTPLHLAAKLGDEEQPIYVHGPYQKMPWEVFWFERVKQVTLPHLVSVRNLRGETAKVVFTKTHKHLRDEAARWVKEKAQACILISALIATINFQAAFTVPGGFDQNTGFPVFLNRKQFIPFMFVLSCALLLSIVCLGAGLMAHLSRFHVEDYFLSIPIKILVEGTAFFLSVMFTIWAYILALYLETSPKAKPGFKGLVLLGVIAANALINLIYIDIMYPIIRITLRALVHWFSYGGQRL